MWRNLHKIISASLGTLIKVFRLEPELMFLVREPMLYYYLISYFYKRHQSSASRDSTKNKAIQQQLIPETFMTYVRILRLI